MHCNNHHHLGQHAGFWVLIAMMCSEGSDEPVFMRSVARAFAFFIHNINGN